MNSDGSDRLWTKTLQEVVKTAVAADAPTPSTPRTTASCTAGASTTEAQNRETA